MSNYRLDNLLEQAASPVAHLVESDAGGDLFQDPWLQREEAALRAAVSTGNLDPSALFEFREAVLSGPTGFGPIGQVGSEHANVIASEDQGWIRAGEGAGAALEAFNPQARNQLVRYLYWLVGHNPIARNVIQIYTTFTVGEGFRVTWKKEADRESWAQTARENDFDERVRRIIWHTYLLGEWFSLLLPKGTTLQVDPTTRTMSRVAGSLESRARGDRARGLRGIGPEQIDRVIVRGDPDYDAGQVPDVETVLAYLRSDGETLLPADDVQHHRFETIGGMTRGVSILFPVLRYLRFHEKWIENRHWINFMRARIPVVRKVAGSSARVNAENLRQQRIPPPGTLVTENMATDWLFPKMELEADDARHDGRAILLAVAAGVGLPEYILTSDASNSNYSTAFAQESPFVKMFENLQLIWIPQICKLVAHLTGKDEDAFSVEPGAVIKRSMKQTVDPLLALRQAGIISSQTVAVRAGFDWDQERDRMRAEEQEREGFEAGDPLEDDAARGGRPSRGDGLPSDGERAGSRQPRPQET